MEDEKVYTWVAISGFLTWSVMVIGLGSIPILCFTLHKMFSKYRKSHYFILLTTSIVCDLLMLTTIFINVIRDNLPFLQGNSVCKYTAFLSTATASQSNWLWVGMYAQRFMHVFYPLHRLKSVAFFRIIEDSRCLLLVTGIFSILSQMWLLFFMQEVVSSSSDGSKFSYCGPNTDIINEDTLKYLQIIELLTTFAFPFIITIVADFSVIFSTHDNNRFTLISAEEIMKKSHTANRGIASSSFKIQSEEGIKNHNLRRQRNIRRCLLVATIHGFLNLPYYLLQVVDEFFLNPSTEAYLYADAIFYLVYLSQFPMKAIFVHLLHCDARRNSEVLNTYRPVVKPKLSSDIGQ